METPNKYMRRTAFVQCPIHTQIREAALDRLIDPGYFEKDEIIQLLQFRTVADSIRWDYVREWLQQETRVRIVPVSPAFFRINKKYGNPRSKMAAEHRRLNPDRCLARGNGKGTAGYCSVQFENGVLALKKVDHLKKMVESQVNGIRHWETDIASVLPGAALPQGSVPELSA